jgi:DNA-binding NarL/FixJ family response regulator
MDVKNRRISVLLIGNNPVELGHVYDFLKNFKPITFIANTSFSLKDSLLKLKEIPNCILVDDNFKDSNINELIREINENEETCEIPVTLLKTSNYNEVNVSGIADFLLKDGLSSENLTRCITNVIKFKKTRRYLYNNYTKNKRRVRKFFN